MITLTNRDTCKACHIPEDCIVDIAELTEQIGGRVYPYTRLHIIDKKHGHDYYIDVTESVKRINQVINEAAKKECEKQEKKDVVIQQKEKGF